MHLLVRDMSGKKRLPEMMTHTTDEQLAFDESLNPATKKAWEAIEQLYGLIAQEMLSLSGQHRDVRFSLEIRKHYLNDTEVDVDGKPYNN